MRDIQETVDRFVPFRLTPDVGFGLARIAGVKIVKSVDFFSSLDVESSHLTQSKLIGGPSVIFTLANGIEIGLGDLDAPSAAVQALILAMSLESGRGAAGIDRATVIDPNVGLTIQGGNSGVVAKAVECWQTAIQAGVLDEAEAATSPKLYGSKLRLASLIVGAAASVLPEGAPILDAMSGTGIASRKLSSRFQRQCQRCKYLCVDPNKDAAAPVYRFAGRDRSAEGDSAEKFDATSTEPTSRIFARGRISSRRSHRGCPS